MNKKQFEALPLSEAILYVIEDVKFFTKIGVEVNMDRWYGVEVDNWGWDDDEWGMTNETEPPTCQACLGGMAVMGLIPCATKAESVEDVIACVNEVREGNIKITETFDKIRETKYIRAFRYWYIEYQQSIESLMNGEYLRLPGDLEDDLNTLNAYHQSFHYILDAEEVELMIVQMYELSLTLYLHGF